MQNGNLKQCSSCGAWLSVEDIFNDPDIIPLGMCVTADNPETAYYYFIHSVPNCGSTFLIPVEELAEFISEPIPYEQLIQTERCKGQCVSLDDLEDCHQDCYFAPYRRLLLDMFEMKTPETCAKSTGHEPD